MKKPNKKESPLPDSNASIEEFLYPKRLQKIMSRRKNLYPKKTMQRRIFPDTEHDPAKEAADKSEDNADVGHVKRLPEKIKMEITFSDESTIEKEIILSADSNADKRVIVFNDDAKEKPSSGDAKIPWVTAAVLAFIVCASLATGIFYWYTTNFRPAENDLPVYEDINTDTPHIVTEGPAEAGDPDVEPEPDEPDTPVITRPVIDPSPEFMLLWEQYGNDDIVAVLTLADTEYIVTQGSDNAFYLTHDINRNTSPKGWVFLDYRVDLLMGLEHNMVIFDPAGSIMRDVLQEYADYDFFLMHPEILLSTLYGDFNWEIFAFYVAPADFPFAVINHPSDETWGETVLQFTLASFYNTMLDVTMYDQVLTIAIPTPIDPELFYILQARMQRQITS